MDDQAVVIKRIRLDALTAYAASFTGPTPPPGIAPITRIRALSQARNPSARPEDVVLLVAYRGDRVIGYHGVLPGLLAVDGRISRVHWSSAVYVTQEFRGRGVGRRLIAAFKSLGKDLMVPGGMTESAAGAYRSGGFRPLGKRAYLQLRLERIDRTAFLPKKLKASPPGAGRRFDSPLRRIDGQAVLQQKKHFYRQATSAMMPEGRTTTWRRVDRISRFTISAPRDRAVFLRENETVNWMLANPWVYSWDGITRQDLANEVRHYYFTKTRELFRYAAFELYSPGERTCKGFVILSLSRTARRAQVKILDYAAEDPDSARTACHLALTAAQRILADRIEIPTGLASHFQNLPLLDPLLKRQALLSIGFPSKEDSPLAASMGKVELGICDGDAAFT